MSFLPGHDGIIDELLVVCALAQTVFVTPQNFTALPYLEHLVHDRSKRAIIERLLSVAIKTRFLDDQTKLLKQKDRRNILIGKYTEDGIEKSGEICIRAALNKLVHHDKIEVEVKNWRCIAVETVDIAPQGTKSIPTGSHEGKRVIVSVEGRHDKRRWLFDIDLYVLIDEMLRVLEQI